MCGISGSNKREQAFKLYQDNLNRGFYSSGLLTLSNKDKIWSVFKTEGSWPKICTNLIIFTILAGLLPRLKVLILPIIIRSFTGTG